MSNIFFISDTHFDHENFLRFEDDAGRKIRTFSSVEEMNETLIANWNSVVRPQDKIYHLGDVTMRVNKFARVACRLHGHKRLIVGNHDDPKNMELTRWFDRVSLWRIFKEHGFLCTHVPIREEQFRKVRYCVHGHIHQNLIDNPAYVNVCVEHTNYTPVSLDELKQTLDRRGL